VPDQGTGIRGGEPLPDIVATTAAGQDVDLGRLPCEQGRDAINAVGLTDVQQQFETTSEPLAPPASPAGNPPSWQVSSGLANGATGGRAGLDQLVSGGPGSNPDNTYIAARVSRAYGDVLVIHGLAPTVPDTLEGEPVMGSGDVRYWSFCQNSLTTRYVACLYDQQVSLNSDGTYTVVISDPANRPSNAINWIPFGPEPEARVIYRQMLPSASFYPYSAAHILASGAPVASTMGPYYPEAAYCSTTQFEQDECGLGGG
jgi:hypothetical protein